MSGYSLGYGGSVSMNQPSPHLTYNTGGGVGTIMPNAQAPGQPGTGLNPFMLASLLGQFGAAMSPQDSWQRNLGNVAANWGGTNLYYGGLQKGIKANQQPSDLKEAPTDANSLAPPVPDYSPSMPQPSYDRRLLQDILASYR